MAKNIKYTLSLPLIIVAIFFSNISYAALGNGINYFDNQEYGKAIAEFKPLVEKGSIKAQNYLAKMYLYGYGVKKDTDQAIKLLKLAAENGDITSQNNLATIYYDGFGVKKNYKKALKWFELSANNGDGKAQIMLAIMNFRGKGMLFKNYKKAIYWAKIAKENKNMEDDLIEYIEIIWEENNLDKYIKNI